MDPATCRARTDQCWGWLVRTLPGTASGHTRFGYASTNRCSKNSARRSARDSVLRVSVFGAALRPMREWGLGFALTRQRVQARLRGHKSLRAYRVIYLLLCPLLCGRVDLIASPVDPVYRDADRSTVTERPLNYPRLMIATAQEER